MIRSAAHRNPGLTLRLIGVEEPGIELLTTKQPGDEHIQKLLDAVLPTRDQSIRRHFTGARWIFASDGTFTFTPSPSTGIREDLSTLSGTYTRTEHMLAFQGERQAPSGTSSSLDGFALIEGDTVHLEALYTMGTGSDRRVARIVQKLSQHPVPHPPRIEVNDITVPSLFHISLSGTSAGQPFGPLSGTLKILPRYPEDPNPFLVILATDAAEETYGGMLWESFRLLRSGQKELISTVHASDREIRMEIIPPQPKRLGVTWSTPNQGDLAFALPIVGITATAGWLTFSILDNQIIGAIHASGTSPFGQQDIYEAQFSGQRQEDGLAVLDPIPHHAPLPQEQVSPLATQQDLAGIPLPSMFNLSLSGATEAKPFGPLSGKLFIMWPEPGDPNRFSMQLTTDQAITHGWIAWSSFTAPDASKSEPGEMNSEIHAQGEQIHLDVKPSDRIRPFFTWYTVAEDNPDVQVAFHIESGRCSFSIQGDQISGEIHVTGVSNEDFKRLSTYTAQITGHRQESHHAREIRAATNSVSFSGEWDTGEDAFGRLSLRQEGQAVEGTFTARDGGTIRGIVRENRLDFTWEGHQPGTGWGLLRAFAGGELLAGIWGSGADKTGSRGVLAVGRRRGLPKVPMLTIQDAQELRYLGYDLVQEGKYRQAVQVLEEALKLYQRERHNTAIESIWQAGYLIDETNILTRLIQCDLQNQQYEQLLQHLTYALELDRLLGPHEDSVAKLGQSIDSINRDLSFNVELLETMQAGFADLYQRLDAERPEYVRAFAALIETVARLQARLAGDVGMWEAMKVEITSKRKDALRVLASLPKFLEDRRAWLATEIAEITALGHDLFDDQAALLQDQAALFGYFRIERCADVRRTNVKAIQAQEERLTQGLKNSTLLTSTEKVCCDAQTKLVITLLSLSYALLCAREHIELLQVEKHFQEREKQAREMAAGLADHIERWRAQLLKELDKLDAQAQAEPFFQKLVTFLVELGGYTEALVVCEQAKSRVFVDLLSIDPDVRRKLRPIVQQEKLILSPTSAPALTLEEINALVKQV